MDKATENEKFIYWLQGKLGVGQDGYAPMEVHGKPGETFAAASKLFSVAPDPQVFQAKGSSTVSSSVVSIAGNQANSQKPEVFLGGVIIDTIGGVKIYQDLRTGNIKAYAGMSIDVDGSPTAYGPNGLGQDYLANAGHAGNWWGIAVDPGTDEPYIQGPNDPAPGYYVSTTALENPQYPKHDPRRYTNSDEVPFIVIPGGVKWAKLGWKGVAFYKDKWCEFIVADIGPEHHFGEGSVALAKALGINPDPKHGGVGSGVTYLIYKSV